MRRQFSLNQTAYRLRPGERIAINAPLQELDFIRGAKTRSAKITETQGKGFIIGPSVTGEVVLAASLTMPRGEYSVTVSATNDAGEERSAAINVTLSPLQSVPSNATKPPVIFLNGWQPGIIDTCPISSGPSQTFGRVAGDLQSDGVPAVYFFDNCVEDLNGLIEDLGNFLGQVLGLIRYDTGALVPQVDLIGHSMGGLVVRSYLAGLRPDGSLSPPLDPRVRKFIEIATPNFGSFLASDIGAQTAEMIPGSPFLWQLVTWNQRGDDLRGVDALAIIGNSGYEPTLSGFRAANASDGVVSVTSASLGFARDSTRTRILSYCHADFGFFSQAVVDCEGSSIAKAPETEQIVRSFLSNNSAWQTIGTTVPQDPWLSRYGGMFVGDLTATNQWVNDVTAVSFGSVPLSFGGVTGIVTSGTLFYKDFVSGTDTFHISSQSLGSTNCGPITEPIGYFTAWRCKSPPLVSSVGPLLSASSRMVQSGGNITISGVGFGQRCSSCTVVAYPGTPLTVSSWSEQSISVVLPSTFNGITQITVQTAAGSDAITFIAAPAPVPPTISLTNSQPQFYYTTGGQTPPAQIVGVSNSGGGTLNWTASANVSWISLTAALNSITVVVNPSGLVAGIYKAAISIIAAGATNSPQTVSATLTIAAAPAPSVVITSITNSASGASGAVAPGEIITIKGSGLGPPAGVSFSVDPLTNTVATTLGGTRVLFGSYAAPITYTSATQINAIVPYEVAGGSAVMQVQYQGVSSVAANLQIAAAAPAAFTLNATGSGPAAAINQDGRINGPLNPAAKGSNVTIYVTGGGQTNPPGVTGSVTGTVLKWLTQAISVTVGGQPATVSFDGAAPTFVDGVGQLNIQLAPDARSGSAVPVVINVGGVSSPGTATLAVQ